MHNKIFDILNYINEGIIIVNKEFEVVFSNKRMSEFLKLETDVVGIPIVEMIPSLDRPYFIDALNQVIEKDYKFFFSSVMHKGLITRKADFNVRLTKYQIETKEYIIIEAVNITGQSIRVKQLKDYANELVGLNQKLTEQERKIAKLAYYDNLTGLANRSFFKNVAEKVIQDLGSQEDKILGLMFIDLDNFKDINDRYGHDIGDKVLIQMARVLEDSTREDDIVGRYGGDEFLILLSDCKSYDNYKIVCERIRKASREIKIGQSLNIPVEMSIGVSFYSRDGNNIDELISKADKSMYREKYIQIKG